MQCTRFNGSFLLASFLNKRKRLTKYSNSIGKLSLSWRNNFCTAAPDTARVRVRFAPSPTGYLHLGGLRTLLYNYLFARSCNGSLILRLEDTDQTRLVPGAAEALYETLQWFQLEPDESPSLGGPAEPYIQSERIHFYQKYTQKLIEDGHAYRCFCTPLRLTLLRKDLARRREFFKYDGRCKALESEKVSELVQQGTPHCVRLNMSSWPSVDDVVFGSVSYDGSGHESDPIILKTDGGATYHLANVLDDHLMGITHVLRGVEWLSSTPKHLFMYRCFGWQPPVFAHLPLLKNEDGSKLSKRQDNARVEHLRGEGYTARTLINLVLGTGFVGRDPRTVYSLQELVQMFDVSCIKSQSVLVDNERLPTLSRADFHRDLDENLQDIVVSALEQLQPRYGDSISPEYVSRVLQWSRNGGVDRLQQLTHDQSHAYIWAPPQHIDLSTSGAVDPVSLLEATLQCLESLPSDGFTKDVLRKALRKFASNNNVAVPVVMKLIRTALCNAQIGDPVGEVLELFGRDDSCRRLRLALRAPC